MASMQKIVRPKSSIKKASSGGSMKKTATPRMKASRIATPRKNMTAGSTNLTNRRKDYMK